jgi:transposase InsO family protein
MPWMEASTMTLRDEFVSLARCTDSNVASLCRRFGISRKTGYKWLGRCKDTPASEIPVLTDRSRRPKHSPTRTVENLEQRVCDLRRAHPAWGGRKIHRRLKDLDMPKVPASSTVTDILRRNQLLKADESIKHKAFRRFEHPNPNDLWQMDFVGHFALSAGRCHPLTVLDDHSRYCLGARACADETGKTVQKHLADLFRRYGLPQRILCDNGSPWGCTLEHPHTWLTAWLIRVGVSVSHGRPYHPQTQGKDERFNRTIKTEVIANRQFIDVDHVQRHFDPWRDIYNTQRPHEALNMATPSTRYRPSSREFPEQLPPIEYSPSDIVRKVGPDGYFSYKAVNYKISQAFAAQPIALRQTGREGELDVFYCQTKVATIDQKQQTRI